MATSNTTTALPALTDIQAEVLSFMYAYYQETKGSALTGLLPSSRDIQVRFGWSSQTAAMGHLKALEKKGYLKNVGGHKSRAYLIVRLPE